MRKKEEKARAVRQQIIADMHNTNYSKYNNTSNSRNNNRANMKQPSSAVHTTNKSKFVSFLWFSLKILTLKYLNMIWWKPFYHSTNDSKFVGLL